MTLLLTIVHVAVCVFLILVVLLQTGKGADLAGAFGGGGSQTAFGARGATTLLHKLTTVSAVLFMATSMVLAILASRPTASVVEDEGTPTAAAPAEAGPAPEMTPEELAPSEAPDGTDGATPAATGEARPDGTDAPAGDGTAGENSTPGGDGGR